MPTRQLLDALVPDRPAYLIAYDGHTGWANTKALKAGRHHAAHQEPGQRHHRQGPAHRRADRRAEGSGDGADERRSRRSRPKKIASPPFAPPSTRRIASASPACRTPAAPAADLELFDRLRKRSELTLRIYQALRADATLDRGRARRARAGAHAVRRRPAAQDRRDQAGRRRRDRIAHRRDARAVRQPPVNQGRRALHARAAERESSACSTAAAGR